MENTIIAYIKQPYESPIPVTVQVKWLADGKIIPLMYWTPDNSRYEVKHVYESIKLAYLKERGVGIRYRVNAELMDIPDYDRLLYAKHETYLYLCDNRYCEKGFIDDRYNSASKKYVPVVLDIFPDGGYELVYFWVDDNRYKVEKTIDIEPRGSFHAGGIGVWHKIDVRLVNDDNDNDPNPSKRCCRLAALFLELNKWFVAVA